MKLTKSWQKFLKRNQQQIKAGNVDVFTAENEKPANRTLALVFKIPTKTGQEIRESLEKKFTLDLKEAIIFQPASGYHISIKWTQEDNIHNLDLEKFKKELQTLFREMTPVKGSILFPVFGPAGHFGVFLTESEKEIVDLRRKLNQLFQAFDLPVGLKTIYDDLIYASLTRYRKKFSPEQISAFNKIKPQEITNVIFSEVLLVLNDKFMTPESTKVLAIFKLGSVKDD